MWVEIAIFRRFACMIRVADALQKWRVSGIRPIDPTHGEKRMAIVPQPCARCGGEIPAERLEAIPGTMVCVQCSKEMGGEFHVIVSPEKTSKEGSLKKNYGGYSTRKIRKPIKRKGEEE